MADFTPAYEAVILSEGGYRLTNIPGDRGGQTYAGISRTMNPSWPGWDYIDRGETPPTQMVRSFYRAGWWLPIRGDDIADQRVAASVFNFAVNTSAYGEPKLAVKLAQLVVGVTPDGDLGPKTLAALNAFNPELFLARFALAKVARYAAICNKDRSQSRFLLGWLNRSLEGAQ
jgi:lysozyme family protein